ncbi:hypothetical protein HJG60_011707 [Phyllostomus discolor]|uniref:Uncharacterized protein n=1 Tax=Phyllostomus discolor TaxID=89673 RepID=A0A833ZZI0_9CHIR|nr:hypothetical protein HJG60_011707 [Phyllostomus discolor]
MWRYPSVSIYPGCPPRSMVESRQAGQQSWEGPELLVVGKSLWKTPMSGNRVVIRAPGEQPPRPISMLVPWSSTPSTAATPRPTPVVLEPSRPVQLGTSMLPMTQVPLGSTTCSVVPLRATPGKTELLSNLQEEPCWSVRQALLQPRPPTSGKCVSSISQVSYWQAPDSTSLSPVAPSNLGKTLYSRSQFADNTHIYTTPGLLTVNVLESEKPRTVTMEAAKKTRKATVPWKGVRTPRLVFLKDESPVSLANQTTKSESKPKDYIEILLKRREDAPKHVRLSQIRGKEIMTSELLEMLEEIREVYSTKSESKNKVENMRRQAERRRAQYSDSIQNRDTEVHINQSPESQSVHMDVWYSESSFPNILPNLRLQQKEEEGYPEVLLQGKPLLQPHPPKIPKPTSMGTKSKRLVYSRS